MNMESVFRALDNHHRRTVLSAMRTPGKHFPRIGDADPLLDGICVAQIAEFLGVNQSTASAYMKLLLDAGLVVAQRVGKYTRYKRNEAALKKLAKTLVNEL